MNTLHLLKYAVEVEKTGSITKAAENLYMNQPHLSKAIKELEEIFKIKIFNRTSKGVIPTSKGSDFLVYAKNILSQIEEMESLCKSKNDNIFKISVPRVSYISYTITKFISSLYKDCNNNVDIHYKENSSMNIIKNISNGEDNWGIVRYQAIYKKDFFNFIEEKHLGYEHLWNFEYSVLMSKEHPLSNKSDINEKDLINFTEISNRDLVIPEFSFSNFKQSSTNIKTKNSINIYDKASQFEILSNVPTSYMYASPIPQEMLDKFCFIQKKCELDNNSYNDIIIFKKGYQFNKNDKAFLEILKNVVKTLSKE